MNGDTLYHEKRWNVPKIIRRFRTCIYIGLAPAYGTTVAFGMQPRQWKDWTILFQTQRRITNFDRFCYTL
jgi:hypothetical protein